MKAHHLEETLAKLKLFGMLDTLEARLGPGHRRRARPRRAAPGPLRGRGRPARRGRARTPGEGGTLRADCARSRTSTSRSTPKIPATQIRDLATLRFVEAGESVILHGPVGVGKSMIAQALGHQACRRGYSVVFTKTSRLLADLAGGHADRSFETPPRALEPAADDRLRRLRHAGLHPLPRPTTSTSS